MVNNWERDPSGLLLPGHAVKKPDPRTQMSSTPTKHKKTKVVELPKMVLAALNYEINALTEKYLGASTDYANVLKLEDALLNLGEDYGVTIVCKVYENAIGEACVDIHTVEELHEVAGELNEYQIVADAVYGNVKVQDDTELLLNPNVSKEDYHKHMKGN